MPKLKKRPDPFPDVFRTRLSLILRHRRETQEHLASTLAISSTHLSKVITGRVPPSGLLRRALELELGDVAWAYCLGLRDDAPPASEAPPAAAPESEA